MNTRQLIVWIKVVWAMPCSAVGACLGAVVLLSGGTLRRPAGALEFALAPTSRLGAWAQAWPFSAITLGHVILGTSDAELDRLRAHELVHVRQYETFGALFFIAYPLASVVAWSTGRCPYRGNCFEVSAHAASGCSADGP
jgi:hypothetical protein